MKTLQGICPAIVTPFDSAGAFDPAALRLIIRHQLQSGVHGFYVGGGTGEGLLLSLPERQSLLETVMDEVRGRVLVIAHVGAFQTPDTLALARHASDLGVDAIAALPPGYFYRPDSIGLVRYYTAVAGASRVPLLVYNIPQRTGINMTPALFEELLRIPNIVGMKDSSGNVYALGLYFAGGRTPVIFNGEDTVLLAGLLAGACGGIGATYNIMPAEYVDLWRSVAANDLQAAARAQARINTLINALLVVDLFGGIKQTMAWMGQPCGEPRSPNRALTSDETAKLRASLESVGFFSGGPA